MSSNTSKYFCTSKIRTVHIIEIGCVMLHCAPPPFKTKGLSIYLVEIHTVLLWCQFFGFGSPSKSACAQKDYHKE